MSDDSSGEIPQDSLAVLNVNKMIYECHARLEAHQGVLRIADPNGLTKADVLRFNKGYESAHWEEIFKDSDLGTTPDLFDLVYARAALTELQHHNRELLRSDTSKWPWQVDNKFVTWNQVDNLFPSHVRLPIIVSHSGSMVTEVDMHELFAPTDLTSDQARARILVYNVETLPRSQDPESRVSVNTSCYAVKQDGSVTRLGRQNELAGKYNISQPTSDLGLKDFHKQLLEATSSEVIIYLSHSFMSGDRSFQVPLAELDREQAGN